MTPIGALSDPVFRIYLAIVLCLLIVAGLVLALLRFGFGVELGGVWKTYRSWWWMVPLVALFLIAGRVVFIIGVTGVALLAGREFIRVAGRKGDHWLNGAIATGILAIGAVHLQRNPTGAAFLLSCLFILLVPVFQDEPQGASRRISSGLLVFLCLGWMFGQLGALANSPAISVF